uniref:integrin beta-1-B-like isoform X2 n=1 Tax=Styela clava TaxID=7725 RepID=UPI001939451A|nr:integrin beta-1-B-like isoform X2 [Styela clava]
MRKSETPFHGLLIVAVIVMTSLAKAQESAESICAKNNQNCKTCINAHPSCAWCGQVVGGAEENNFMQRCKTVSQIGDTCNSTSANVSDSITNPMSHIEIVQNVPFTVVGPDYFDNETNVGKTVVQMMPQNITVKLRKGQSVKLNVTFRKVIDYPLDIYYVMDLSNSMKDDLEVLQTLGTSLFDDIKANVTNNTRLGFGSFVDKVMMPYTSTVEEQLKNPCANQENATTCAPPFGFRHVVNITGNAAEFVNAIKLTRISGNIDIPEGSLDALMQIAVCTEHIYWREGATHVILLTTDASPHLAMDGKLAAILEANDMKCHLEPDTSEDSQFKNALVYSKSKFMDYPSLGQLKKVFQDNKIHSIYAVTENVHDLYKPIEKVLNDAYVAVLKSDSSNIIPLIHSTYSKLKGKLALTTPKSPDNVEMSYRVFCPHDNTSKENELQCEGLEINDEVVFEFEFKAKECLSNPMHEPIILKSSSLQDEVHINIEYLCECECQNTGEAKSDKCNTVGSLECGVCSCDEGKEGSQCQCDSMVDGTPVNDKCKKPGSELQCENVGRCDCGKCKQCIAPYNGTYCHCLTTGCPDNEQGVCGGKDKGWCNNCPGNNKDKCVCLGQYTIRPSDKTCSCHPDECKKDKTLEIQCSGRGNCSCDTCVCKEPTKWSGRYCDTCIHPSCTGVDMTCAGDTIRTCAECKSRRDDCTNECKSNSYTVYSKVSRFPDCSGCTSTSTAWDCKECNKFDATQENAPNCKEAQVDGCTYEYRTYWLKTNQFQVYVKEYNKEEDCPKPVNPVLIVLPVIGGILIFGVLALIIWKLYTDHRDKVQYEEFLEEQERRKWTKGENPIFEKPDQKFANPMFDGKDE